MDNGWNKWNEVLFMLGNILKVVLYWYIVIGWGKMWVRYCNRVLEENSGYCDE